MGEDAGVGPAEPGGARKSTRGRLKNLALGSGAVAALLAGAGVFAKDQLTFTFERGREEVADRAESAVDAQRLRTELTFPGGACNYGGAVGWGEISKEVVLAGENTVIESIKAGSAISQYGTVRLHFTLPTTADKATIDVREINPVVVPVALPDPGWAVMPEGCGGGQYSRKYTVLVKEGQPKVSEILEDGTVSDEPFAPFTVSAGETVFLDYEILLCRQGAAVDLQFSVTSVSDAGIKRTSALPSNRPIRVVHQTPKRAYFADVGALQEYQFNDDFFSDSYLCD